MSFAALRDLGILVPTQKVSTEINFSCSAHTEKTCLRYSHRNTVLRMWVKEINSFPQWERGVPKLWNLVNIPL